MRAKWQNLATLWQVLLHVVNGHGPSHTLKRAVSPEATLRRVRALCSRDKEETFIRIREANLAGEGEREEERERERRWRRIRY